jgi:hypothetical protein
MVSMIIFNPDEGATGPSLLGTSEGSSTEALASE